MKKRTRLALIPSVALAGAGMLVASGCATKRYVNDGLSVQDSKIADVETQVEENQRRIAEASEKIVAVDGRAMDAQRIGKDAGTKAAQAEVRAGEALDLARGKLLYKVVLSDVAGRFSVDQWELSDESRARLDEMAARLKSENANIYIEIEGHTDGSGGEAWNLTLGQHRAEAVRRYLNMQHGIPLHRMSLISFGEAKPIADNGTKEGRAQNRRVEVKVLS